MKKTTLYILLLALFGGSTAFIIYKYKSDEKQKQEKIYTLLERTGPVTDNKEWIATKEKVNGLIDQLKEDPENTKANLDLAAAFIMEARVTGNHMYYDMAALKHLNDVLNQDPDNFSALCYKSLLYLSQHHFAEGLEIGKRAQAINPHNAFIYGLLTDANVELGNYKVAVEMSDKMESVKPDIRSYSRVSYLREIYGDYPGAIEAMKLAVAAGPPGAEGTEWARVQLGHLYEFTGEIKKADSVYQLSLNYRPGYAYALGGLARIAVFYKDYNKAVSYYQQADALVSDNSFKEDLADVYIAMNDQAKADATVKQVIEQLNKDSKSANADDAIGHYSDNELALDYLKIKDYDNAIKHAETEYNRRPENITVNETLAWVYYKKGDAAKALEYIKVALKTNSKNPELLCRAGLIHLKNGDKASAKNFFNEALQKDPSMNVLLKKEAKDAQML